MERGTRYNMVRALKRYVRFRALGYKAINRSPSLPGFETREARNRRAHELFERANSELEAVGLRGTMYYTSEGWVLFVHRLAHDFRFYVRMDWLHASKANPLVGFNRTLDSSKNQVMPLHQALGTLLNPVHK